MKKMYLVLLAAVMGISFSAFTAKTDSRSTSEVTYQDDDEVWHIYEGPICPDGDIVGCTQLTEDGPRQLFYDNDPSQPLKRNTP